MNAKEGWLKNGEYVRLYAAKERPAMAARYGFQEFLPEYELWGSWGQDALCRGKDGVFYLIPWIPLTPEHRTVIYRNVDALLAALAQLKEATPAYEHFGKEIHFVKPIVFGGDPNAKNNLAMIPQEAHAKICRFWNKTYQRVRSGKPA